MATTIKYPDGLSRAEWLVMVDERRNPFYRYPEKSDALLWRYVDFSKLVGLLDSSSLFFPNATLLDDPFEGAVSPINLINRQRELDEMAKFFNETSDDSVRQKWLAGTRDRLEHIASTSAAHHAWTRAWTYISCWHMNPYESAAMWKLYGITQQAIGIVTTFQRLKDALSHHVTPPHAEPRLGLVNYVDYDNEPIPRNVHLSEFFYKRKSFQHECELRAVIQKLPLVPIHNSANYHYDTSLDPIPGLELALDLNILIERLYVAPTAPDWFFLLVKNIAKKYDLTCEVLRSRLDNKPVY